MIRRLTYVGFTLMLFSAAGCSSISDMCLEQEMSCRNHVLAYKAWGEWSWCYDELNHPHHFAKGFRAGYQNILAGGKGCQPTLPPRCYWKPCFQCPEGQSQIQSWFDGFSHGALAAQQDGYGNMHTIPMSSNARQNFLTMKIPVSDACFAELGDAETPGHDELLEMPGPIMEYQTHESEATEGQIPGSIEVTPRSYEM